MWLGVFLWVVFRVCSLGFFFGVLCFLGLCRLFWLFGVAFLEELFSTSHESLFINDNDLSLKKKTSCHKNERDFFYFVTFFVG